MVDSNAGRMSIHLVLFFIGLSNRSDDGILMVHDKGGWYSLFGDKFINIL